MSTTSQLLKLLVVASLCTVVMFTRVDAITCDDVNNDLLPCLSYITSGGQVPADCCSGMKTLVNSAKAKNDRQTACSCLKSLVSSANDAELQRASGLPKLCGVNIPFKISRNINCSKVH